MSVPFVTPGGRKLISAEGTDALTLHLDMRAVPQRDHMTISNTFLRDCLAVATAMPTRRIISIGQTAIHVLRLPGGGGTFPVAFIPPHNRLGSLERFALAEAISTGFAERGYRLSAFDAARWAAAPGLDAAAQAAGRSFLGRHGGPADTRLAMADPTLRPLLS